MSNFIRQKKLHLGHIAFMRAVVQGLNTRDSWDRYLRLEGEHDDARNVRRMIQWIRDEFAAAAKRHERHGMARLVQIDTNRITEPAKAIPTLEEFAAERGLHDFSQAEQLEYYEEFYRGKSPGDSRRSKLIAKQLEALLWLEGLVAHPPQADDKLAFWLNPDLAAYLEKAGIVTIRELVERVNGIGLRWWAGIHAIGTAKAARILHWLRMHETTIGLPIGAHIETKRSALKLQDLQKVVQQATAIVPIEKFIVPAALDGAKGIYRAPIDQCGLDARNDLEACMAWLRSKSGLDDAKRMSLKRQRGIDSAGAEGPLDWLQYLSHTQRAYLKEIERFMLWAIVQRKKALSSLTADDCQAYCEFIADPVPAKQWCGPRGREKWSPLWRPFEGPLSVPAQRHAITILKNLYKFLVENGYMERNPWHAIKLPKKNEMAADAMARAFTPEQWSFVESRLNQLPDTSKVMRLRFALHLFHATGLRLAEGVALRVSDLICIGTTAKGSLRWEIQISGAGAKRRNITLPDKLAQELSAYLLTRGLNSEIQAPENQAAYLIGKATDLAERAPWSEKTRLEVDPRQGIAPGTLYDQFKEFFKECAELQAATDALSARNFAAASTQWLRHTYKARTLAGHHRMPEDGRDQEAHSL